MRDPERLLRRDADVARLVDVMRKDGPSEVQMSRALSLANDVAALANSREPASSWFGRTSIRIGLTIFGAAVIGVIVAASASRGAPVARPGTSSLALTTAPSPERALATPPAEGAVASVRVDELPSAPAAPVIAAPVQRSPLPRDVATAAVDAGSLPVADTFAEELALTSEARSALGRGDLLVCSNAVDRYQRRFPTGIFAQEIDVIRIEALAKSGARESARVAAERFLMLNDGSPYADRVRSVLDNTRH